MNRSSLPTTDRPIAVIVRHQGKIPVRLDLIAKQLGLRVLELPLGLGISGSLCYAPGCSSSNFTIEVDSDEVSIRRRFTLAHEIAHYVLHRDVIRDGGKIVDNAMYRSKLSSKYESQANRLAADILMPKNRVREEFGENSNTVALAAKFKVSEQVMKIRLGHLGHLGLSAFSEETIARQDEEDKKEKVVPDFYAGQDWF